MKKEFYENGKKLEILEGNKLNIYKNSIININIDKEMKRNFDLKLMEDSKIKNKIAKPFLKWAGGKRSIIKILLENAPLDFNKYYEPFLGGGALFFALKPQKAILSDFNLDLILTYNVIKTNPKDLINSLKIHQKNHNKDYYYLIRNNYNNENPIEIASRFIYLNKTCFNGLYRVNSKGEFNVPIGTYENPLIADEENIINCHLVFKNIEMKHLEFNLTRPSKGDFVYLDPPYYPIDSNSFTKYTKNNFNEGNQIKLFKYCKRLTDRGVKFMLSNSNTNFIRNLYKDFDIKIVSAPRTINCKVDGRKAAEEVLVRNY